MGFETTAIYALPLGVMYLGLWMDISRTRAALKVSIGDGGDKTLLLRVRRHGNFIDWVSIIMIMMILAESLGAPAVYCTFRVHCCWGALRISLG